MENILKLEIIYESDDLIAINKPHGLLVHRSKIAPDVQVFALQLLRDQIGQKVFLSHRLDRKTSGVLLFNKTRESNSEVQQLFMNRNINKTYLAIVRGFVDDCTIDYPLNNDGKIQEAHTNLKCLEQFEIDVPFGQHQTSRYSYVELTPSTGRFHQLRKHMAHIHHPIIGDRPHGCNKQNRLWKEKFNMTSMMLHAASLEFIYQSKNVLIKANKSAEFQRVEKIIKNES